jgi:hypothetical protein
MCRSIKTLRPPFAEQVTDTEIRAAALQYVRKVSGFRAPASHNAAAFERAVDEIAAATAALLGTLEVRGSAAARGLPAPVGVVARIKDEPCRGADNVCEVGLQAGRRRGCRTGHHG